MRSLDSVNVRTIWNYRYERVAYRVPGVGFLSIIVDRCAYLDH